MLLGILACDVLLLIGSSLSLRILLVVDGSWIWRRWILLDWLLNVVLDGVWFHKLWTLKVVMNVTILFNNNFDILFSNKLWAFHEHLDSLRVQLLNLVLSDELLFFSLGHDWEIVLVGFI